MGRSGKAWVGALLVLVMATCNDLANIRSGAPRECVTVDDCLVEEPECQFAKLCKDALCVFQDQPAGTLLEDQIAGDCADILCDGAGKTTLRVKPADVPNDGDPCTLDECIGTTPKHTPVTEFPCYWGSPETRKVGICADGIQKCDEAGKLNGGCEGQVLPRKETCLFELDEDCDGKANEEGEGCVCEPGHIQPCPYTGPADTEGVGICRAGIQTCTSAGLGYGACDGEQTPEEEKCDAMKLDENCDGQSNEGC